MILNSRRWPYIAGRLLRVPLKHASLSRVISDLVRFQMSSRAVISTGI
ncbi:hypothetical protein [Caudoviricetes sp.]|nr:hypothetical protein [Caudoviricetes sp.]